MSKNLSSNTKLFADDTYIFSPVKNISVPTDQVNNNFEKFSNWPCHWKILFTSDPKKQAQEVTFLGKERKMPIHQSFFNNVVVKQLVILFLFLLMS